MSAASAAVVAIAVLTLPGCITETTGGMPGPKGDDERVKAQLDLARGYIEEGDFSRARTPIDRALDIDSRAVEAHVLKALLLQSEGEVALADAQYQKALRFEPNNSQALNNYGAFLFRQNRFEDALPPLRKVVQDTDYPKRAQAYENLGLAELRVGDTAAAEVAFQRSLRLNLVQPRASLELAHIYFESGQHDLAQQYYDGFTQSARQTARSLWLGIQLSRVAQDNDVLASYALALRNLFPDSDEYRLFRNSQQ